MNSTIQKHNTDEKSRSRMKHVSKYTFDKHKTIQFMKTPVHKKMLIKIPDIISCLEEEDKGLWKEEKWSTN